MSKIATIILLALINLFPFAQITFASDPCTNYGITYSPNAFSANPSSITLNFLINNENTAKNLAGKSVRLHFGGIGPFSNDTSDEKIISGTSFALTVTASGQLGAGQHTPVLDWKPDSSKDFEEFCKDVSYYVADPNVCIIDPNLPKTIPPATSININFSGKPTTQYSLIDPSRKFSLKDTTTNSNGQGSFENMLIPGNNGDQFVVDIITSDKVRMGGSSCTTMPTIKLDISAPKPPDLNPGSVPTPGPGAGVVPPGTSVTNPSGVKVCAPGDPKCTTGGGSACDGTAGINTAIGCIHTNPIDLVKDLFKFLTAVGGGIAFLMMLLGAFQMITSAGNPETLKAGQDRFTSAIIGLLFVIFAVLFMQIIGVGILGIPGFK